MRNLPPAFKRLFGTYVVLGVLLWTTPLLSVLHAESAAVVATVAYFVAGFSTRSFLRTGFAVRDVLLMQEAALLVPWLLLTLSLFWQPNCGYLQGLIFYITFPPVTVVFAVGLMALLHAIQPERSRLIFSLLGLLVLILPPIYDVGLHPQFFTYNHIFGGFLGPIYDDQITMRPGLFAFRSLTLLWSLFFLFSASAIEQKTSRYPSITIALAIAICYVFAPKLGMITTHGLLQTELGSVRQTAHFDIYYDATVVEEEDLIEIAEEHEFRYTQLSKTLQSSVAGRIQSYIYPDSETKARLTGARYTNVAPVWLKKPQTHVLYSAFPYVFPHELAHVFSREFGLPVLRASVSVGLIEGLAVALEPPDGMPHPHEQVAAALLSGHSGTRDALSRSTDLAQSLAGRLTPLGFWTGRGAVSYTTMGSFVGFLIETYGADRFKAAYPRARFAAVYGKTADELAAEWNRYVLGLDVVARSSEAVVSSRFQAPSLFEKDCPHYVPPYRRGYDEAVIALVHGDSLRSLGLLDEAIQRAPNFVPALELWAGLRIAHGGADDVLVELEVQRRDTLSPVLLIRQGDAHALLGRTEEAARYYEDAVRRLPSHAHEARSRVLLRLSARMHPAVMRAYLLENARHADLVDTTAGSAATALLALHEAKKGRFELALTLMRTTSPSELANAVPVLGGELARRRFVWLSQLAYRSGSLEEAADFAADAAAAYRRAGAFNEAAVQDEFRRRVEWLAEQELENLAYQTSGERRLVRLR